MFIKQLVDKTIVALNTIKVRALGIPCGHGMRIRGRIGLQCQKGARIVIGNGFICSSGNMSNPIGRNVRSFIRVHSGAELVIGNNVGISSTCIWCKERIVIEDNVKVGALCVIMDTDCHSLDPLCRMDSATDSENALHAPIRICRNAFIGASSIICKGVTIGENAIIGAGSVVTRDIPRNQIWAGNPIRFVREQGANN